MFFIASLKRLLYDLASLKRAPKAGRTMFTMHRFALMIAVVSFAFPVAALEVGETVVVVRRSQIIDAGRAVDTVGVGTQLKVLGIEGPRVQVSNGHPGWVDAASVATPREATDYFTTALRASPGDAALLFARGNVYRTLGEFDLALSDMNEAIRRAPQAAGYNGRGRVWFERGDYARALADYDRAVQLSPNSAMLYNNRSAAYEKLGQYDRALGDCQRALQLNPKFSFAAVNRDRLIAQRSQPNTILAAAAPAADTGGE